jgi:hypothetical protein
LITSLGKRWRNFTLEHVERWHKRFRDEGLADVSIRDIHGVPAALPQAVLWGLFAAGQELVEDFWRRRLAPEGIVIVVQLNAPMVTTFGRKPDDANPDYPAPRLPG